MGEGDGQEGERSHGAGRRIVVAGGFGDGMTLALSLLILLVLVGVPGGRCRATLVGALATPMRVPVAAALVAGRIRPSEPA